MLWDLCCSVSRGKGIRVRAWARLIDQRYPLSTHVDGESMVHIAACALLFVVQGAMERRVGHACSHNGRPAYMG